MLGYRKDNYIYLRIPKNGCTTYSMFLESKGWTPFELSPFEDYSNCLLWGHLTDPEVRYAKGLTEYLMMRYNEDEIEYLLSDPVASRLLISGVYDQHTYPITTLLGPHYKLPIHWIPLDFKLYSPQHGYELNGDGFTNVFFKEHGFNYVITPNDRRKVGSHANQVIRGRVQDLKFTHKAHYGDLVVNALNYDIVLYHKIMLEYVAKFNQEKFDGNNSSHM